MISVKYMSQCCLAEKIQKKQQIMFLNIIKYIKKNVIIEIRGIEQ